MQRLDRNVYGGRVRPFAAQKDRQPIARHRPDDRNRDAQSARAFYDRLPLSRLRRNYHSRLAFAEEASVFPKPASIQC